jgi:pentatricopeptide repeat protein
MGHVPSLSAFNEMVGKLCRIEDVTRANEMLTNLLDEGFLADEITYSNLISGYAKNNQIQEMLKLYYEMEYRSLSPGLMGFTSLIKGLCNCGKLEEAEKYLRIMIGRSLNPREDVYEALIKVYFEKGDKRRALNLYNEMVSKGLKLCCSHYLGAST